MRYIQTLYIDKTKNPLIDSFGWYEPKYHLMGWALSCLSLQKVLGPLELFVNEAGKDLLIDKLNLPYSAVHISMLDWNLPHPQLWALPKIHTYGIQTSPFIHIDGDIFLFEKFPQRIEKGEIVAQNIERYTDYYYEAMAPIKNTFTYLPQYIKPDFKLIHDLKALNAGIMGGSNICFFKQYSKEAFKYVYSNLSFLENIDISKFNILFEQHLCYKMAEHFNINIEYLINDVYEDCSYKNLADFYKIPINKANYFHLLGQFKMDEFTCKQMANTLRHLYPQYYYRIVNIFTTKGSNNHMNGEMDKLNRDIFVMNKTNIDLSVSDDASEFDLLKDLESYKDNITDETENKDKLEKDYDTFQGEVKSTVSFFSKNYSESYIDGRDIDCFYWYRDIMGSEELLDQLSHIVIKKAPMIRIIQSKYNWTRLFRKRKTNGISYYNDFKYSDLTEGEFYTIIINEKGCFNASIFDINALEKCILSEIDKPTSIDDLVLKLIAYIDEEVQFKHMKEFKEAIYEFIKRLILIKAIMPG